MGNRITCIFLHDTGDMTGFHEGINSPVYEHPETGKRYHTGRNPHPGIEQAPDGAIWVERGGLLCVRTPGGDWHPERPPRGDSAGWTIEGVPPKLTIRPSILFTWPQKAGDGTMVTPLGVRTYHAFLTDGVLEEC